MVSLNLPDSSLATPSPVGVPHPLDRLRRPLKDLRISLTDRCNFRCTYCMPREVFGPGYEFLHQKNQLNYDEIVRLAGIFHQLGVSKIRLTGGEPLMRKGVPDLVRQLRSQHPGLETALTTNGSLLARHAIALHSAGLHRVSVSLDALDDATFMKMNDSRVPASKVVEGIETAVEAGFFPVKINTVIRRGVNEHAILELADRFSGPQYVVRFIEYMDVGNSNGWRMEDVVPASEIATRLEMGGSLEPLPPREIGEVARRYRTPGGGEIGIIASVTRPFCSNCNRARLSSDGKLFTCLFGSNGTDLRGPLRSGASDQELATIIRNVWEKRGDRYSEIRSAEGSSRSKIEMSAIGG